MHIRAYGYSREDRQRLESMAARLPNLRLAQDLRSPGTPPAAWLVVTRTLGRTVLESLVRMDEGDPRVPIVVVTELDVPNLVKLARVRVHGVAGYDQPVDAWYGAIQEAVALDLRYSLAEQARMALHLPELIRIGLMRLARTIPPFRTARGLALSLGCADSTLRLHFRKLQTGWRLEDLIDLFILYHFGWSCPPKDSVRLDGRAAPPASRTLDRMALRLRGRKRESALPPGLSDHPLITILLRSSPSWSPLSAIST